MTHLTEAERQGLADGSLAADHTAALATHLSACADCAADVARLRSIVQTVHDLPAPAATLDGLWPDIRARIKGGKVRALPAQHARPPAGRHARRVAWLGAAVAAAACIAAGVYLRGRRPADVSPVPNGAATLVPAGDSNGTSQADIQRLLDEIQMEKAMLPPATAAVADSDLRAIDAAIAELREALARDPNNPAIRQLLAESYRQQQDLLKRLHNAS
ncbi:MAG TPA: hypothetical protein VJO52_11810 [Gemmatimonadaceae bacterium]|nr:hypothetical protein [Gemmatimonadaceae bacterium]